MRCTRWLVSCLLVAAVATWFGLSQAAEDKYEPLKRFSQVLNLVEENYVKNIGRKELIDDAIKGMLQQLDPHSAYLNKDEFKEMQDSTSGEFGGIGIEISMDQGRLLVISPIEDTPAYKAGLKAGDHIIEINGQTTQDISLTDAVRKIRGPKGTPVTLTVLHEGSNDPLTVEILRDTIPIQSVKTELLEDGVLWLRLTRFNENTTTDLHEALEKNNKKDKPLRGVVLDLRNNPGGLLNQAVSVADTFLDEGLIVYIKGKEDSSRKDYNARSGGVQLSAPMVCLINAGSASASEIVAGALQDHKRALIMGEKSFGKGSVQTVIPMGDGSGIKLTTALYYTPKGRSIQAEGIEPDLVVPFEPVAKDDAKDAKGFTVREKDLSRHLENSKTKAQDKGRDAKVGEMLRRDNQLRLALEMVKSLPAIRSIR